MSRAKKAAAPINIDCLIKIISQRSAAKSRFVVAIAGPLDQVNQPYRIIWQSVWDNLRKSFQWMGFHLDNDRLQEIGLLQRKGAPETFNALGLLELMRKMRGNETFLYPTFDRKEDRTIPNAGRITQEDRIVLVEGNYLLLKTAPWSELSQFFDITVALDVCRDTLQSRLIDRLISHGFSEPRAREKALSSDMVNVSYVQDKSCKADYSLKPSV